MAIFTAIGAAFSAISAFTIGGVAVGSMLLQAAVGIGLNLIASAIAGKPPTPTPSLNGSLRSGGDVPRSFIMGRYATAGSFVWANTWGKSGDTPNAFLTQVIAISDLPIGGLVEVWVNGEKCTLITGEPHADGRGYPVQQYRKDGKDNLWIKFYDGTQTTADSFLTTHASNGQRGYANTRVGYGVAYAIATASITKNLFSGFPSFKFVVDGVKLYDITKDSTAGGSGSQRLGDPSTWGGDGDHLPAVQAYNLLRGLTWGSEWFYGLQGVTAARLPAANWRAQIARCRAEIEGANGPEPTYRSGGEITIDAPLATALEAINTTCQGRISEVGGFYSMFLGAPGTPSFSFTDDDILSTEEQSFTPFFGLADTINGVAATYPSPADGWVMKPAPALYRADLEALHGNRRLMADVELALVPYAEQAQRLIKGALAEGQRARRHTFVLPPSFWAYAVPGEVGEYTSARNGYETKSFRVDGAVDRANLDVMVDLTEVDPADFNWNTGTDYEPPVDGPVGPIRPAPAPIIDWFAEPATITNGSAVRPGLKLTWDGTLTGILGVEFQVRLAATLDVVHQGRMDDAPAGAILISQNLFSSTLYGVRGRYILDGQDGEWSDWLAVTTPNVRETDIEATLGNLSRGVKDMLADQRRNMDNVRSMLETLAAASVDIATQASQATSVAVKRGDALAAATQELSASVEEINDEVTAIAEATTAVLAQVGTGAAEGLFRVTAEATPGDAQARIGLSVRATAGGVTKAASLFLDALASGKARIVTVADQFMIADEEGNVLALFDATGGTINNARIKDLTADNITALKLDAAEVLQDGTLITDLLAFSAVTEYEPLPYSLSVSRGASSSYSIGPVVVATLTVDNPADNPVIAFFNFSLTRSFSGSGTAQVALEGRKNGVRQFQVQITSGSSVNNSTTIFDNDAEDGDVWDLRVEGNIVTGGGSSGSIGAVSQSGILFWKR